MFLSEVIAMAFETLTVSVYCTALVDIALWSLGCTLVVAALGKNSNNWRAQERTTATHPTFPSQCSLIFVTEEGG